MMKKLIDISEHNGKVNLSLASSYIDGVIARCSWGWDKNQIDQQWHNNAKQANKLGIPLFAYHFCYARNEEEARKEAEVALYACEKYKVNVIYYDIEYSDFQGELEADKYFNIAKTFCDIIELNGYSVGIYANTSYFKTKLINDGFSKWTLWLADYGNNDGYDNWSGSLKYNPFNNVLIHQFTSNAKEGIFKNIKGIPSKMLDGNVDYGLLKIFGNNIFSKEIRIGSKVKVKLNSEWYDGKEISSFVYNEIYDVIEIVDDRAVIGKNNKITGAIHINDLYYAE